jgi:hypothetical protein
MRDVCDAQNISGRRAGVVVEMRCRNSSGFRICPGNFDSSQTKHRNAIHINLVPPVDTELDPGSQTYVGGGIDTPSMTRVNADRGCPGEKSAP